MVRSIENFNDDWVFHLGDLPDGQVIELDDDEWESVILPHDWSIGGQFKEHREENWTLFRRFDSRIGYLPQGIGWYRKHFNLPVGLQGKRVFIQFDGIYCNSDVWINGQHLGFRPYGYRTFWYDLTPYVKFGSSNVIAVKVNNLGVSSRWYPGSGIYRKVTLITTELVHVAHWGTYWTTPEVSAEHATVNVHTQIMNETSPEMTAELEVGITLTTEIWDSDIKVADVSSEQNIINGETEISQELSVDSPKLW